MPSDFFRQNVQSSWMKKWSNEPTEYHFQIEGLEETTSPPSLDFGTLSRVETLHDSYKTVEGEKKTLTLTVKNVGHLVAGVIYFDWLNPPQDEIGYYEDYNFPEYWAKFRASSDGAVYTLVVTVDSKIAKGNYLRNTIIFKSGNQEYLIPVLVKIDNNVVDKR